MSKTDTKKLSVFQLYSIITVLIVIGAVVLITSGLFDASVAKSVEHNHPPIANSNAVDLNVINEINRLEEIVKNNPKNHETLLRLGHLLNDNGYYDRAIEKYEIYIKDHPQNVDVIVDMGVCYFEMKQYDKSIETIKRALEVNPKHQIANFNLGIVNFADNNVAEARKWWQNAVDIDPNSNIGKKAEELLKSNN